MAEEISAYHTVVKFPSFQPGDSLMRIGRLIKWVVMLASSALLAGDAGMAQQAKWSEQEANEWYAKQPFLIGSNYNPATAINELEMWQAETFDLKRIDLELGWAEDLGMNTMRVFLHDLAYSSDPKGLISRLDQFLQICDKHKIRPMLVLFDSCWDPFPAVGKQPPPRPGIHNSGWLQSPGAIALADASEHPRLREYVTGVVGAFAQDNRILCWDIWNEPDNTNASSYGASEPSNKLELVQHLLPQAFAWARSMKPVQPLTSGVWKGDYSSEEKLDPIQRIQLSQSDVISFHSYDSASDFEHRIRWLSRYNRPILCTEYMARGNNSTFQGSLPIAKQNKVGAYNWGFVAGKTQTFLPWDSWQNPYVGREPAIWFHEILRLDGTPYKEEETNLIKQVSGKAKSPDS